MRGWLIVALAACEHSDSRGTASASASAVASASASASDADVPKAPNLPSPDTADCPKTCAPLETRVKGFADLQHSVCSGAIGDAQILAPEASDMGCGDHMVYVGCCAPIDGDTDTAGALARLGWKQASHDQRVALAEGWAEWVDRTSPLDANDALARELGNDFTPLTASAYGSGVQLDFWQLRISVWEEPPAGMETLEHLRIRFDDTGAETIDKLGTKDVPEETRAEGQYKMKP